MAADRPTAGSFRQIAFFVCALLLSLFFIPGFIVLTAFTIGLWFAHQNPTTTPVDDLSFFALGAILIGVGCVVQLRVPVRQVAGVQQIILALVALAVAGLLGARREPLVGALLFLLVAAVLVALHPARRSVFALGKTVSIPMAALALLATVPAVAYAANMLAQARQAGPSCFFGQCAHGDRFAEMAACAIAIVLVSLLAAVKTPGWSVPAWSAAVAALILGLTSIALPAAPGALGLAWGVLAVAWGVLVIAMAAWEARKIARLARSAANG